MQCPECKAIVRFPDARFCQVCGCELKAESGKETIPVSSDHALNTNPQPVPQITSVPNQTPEKKIPWIPIIAAGSVLFIMTVVMIVIAIVVVSRRGVSTEETKRMNTSPETAQGRQDLTPVTEQNSQNRTSDRDQLTEEDEQEIQQVHEELLEGDIDGDYQQMIREEEESYQNRVATSDSDEEEESYQNSVEAAEQDKDQIEKKGNIVFTCQSEIRDADFNSMLVQINDLVFDFSLKRSMTVNDVEALLKTGSLHYVITNRGGSEPYTPDAWVSPGKFEMLYIKCEENKALSFGLWFKNFTDDIVELQDAVLSCHDTGSETPYIWFPRGVRRDAEGLNYDNVPELFPGYEIVDYDMWIHDGEAKLMWNPSNMCFTFRTTPYVGSYGNTEAYNYCYYDFYIDKNTKEVSSFAYYYREYYPNPTDNTVLMENELEEG